jgi:hypothetical protein
MYLEDITAKSQALQDAIVSENRNANNHLQKQIGRLTQQVSRKLLTGCRRKQQNRLPTPKRQRTTNPQTKTKTGRPKSRRTRQRYYKGLEQKENHFEKLQEQTQATAILNISRSVDFKIKSRFGFISEPQKPPSHNLAAVLLSLPLSSLFASRPTSMACHDLCEHRIPPPKLQSLLGLGLNFCLHPFTSTPNKTIDESIARFPRDIYVKFFFSGSADDWDPKQLFIRSEWELDHDDLPADFRSRVSFFI